MSRRASERVIAAGNVKINGKTAQLGDKVDPENDTVVYNGKVIKPDGEKKRYIMLNKPLGYVTTTSDEKGRETVLSLLDGLDTRVYPVGRLDMYSEGLLILTNDGEGAHRLLSPKHHVSKVYKFESKFPLSELDVKSLESGVDIGGYFTKPCEIKLYDNLSSGEITLTEGKYHQIKRMLEAVNNKITYLERISFGNIALDPKLLRGEWRYLTEDEEKIFNKN